MVTIRLKLIIIFSTQLKTDLEKQFFLMWQNLLSQALDQRLVFSQRKKIDKFNGMKVDWINTSEFVLQLLEAIWKIAHNAWINKSGPPKN